MCQQAGSTHQYEVEWTQVLREGYIEENSESEQGRVLGTYRILVDLQCQRVGVINIE
jgi:aspartate-semialdehyde dehydrogenase